MYLGGEAFQGAMIKKLLLAGMFFGLAACAGTNDVATFYHRNPSVAVSPPIKAEPAFVLAEPSTIKATVQGYLASGYHLLGASGFPTRPVHRCVTRRWLTGKESELS